MAIGSGLESNEPQQINDHPLRTCLHRASPIVVNHQSAGVAGCRELFEVSMNLHRATDHHNVMSEIEKEYPTQKTLDKYGLSRKEFYKILKAQGNVCPICEKVPSTGRWVIDHEHVAKWKKMPPEKRKLFVRGVLCWFCNSVYLGRAITIKKSQNVTRYLKNYAIRQKRTI